jgi:predicted kinase
MFQALLNDEMISSDFERSCGLLACNSSPESATPDFELSHSTQLKILKIQASTLLLLIGLPGSGKSTLAATLLQQSSARSLISTDAIRSQLFGDAAVQGSWQKVWREVESQFQQAVQQISAGEIQAAIYDATNSVRRQRRAAIALARFCGFTQVIGIWLQTPLQQCLERNLQRDRQVPPEVILQMHRCLVGAPPSLQDGLDDLMELDSHVRLVNRLN